MGATFILETSNYRKRNFRRKTLAFTYRSIEQIKKHNNSRVLACEKNEGSRREHNY